VTALDRSDAQKDKVALLCCLSPQIPTLPPVIDTEAPRTTELWVISDGGVFRSRQQHGGVTTILATVAAARLPPRSQARRDRFPRIGPFGISPLVRATSSSPIDVSHHAPQFRKDKEFKGRLGLAVGQGHTQSVER
jgi:hypothetical protein